MDVPGGIDTMAKIVPVSSLGTKPVGVDFIKKNSTMTLTITVPIDNHLWFIKNEVWRLYFLSTISYAVLKEV